MSKYGNPDDLLSAGEAARYLAKKWGRESYSVEAFRMLRHRWGLKPAEQFGTETKWRRGDLDKIQEPDRSKPRPRRKKDPHAESIAEGVDTEDHYMVSYA